MNDRALVSRLVAGDPDGLATAYRIYGDRLYTYCHGLLDDSEAAAEALHDTFVIASQFAGKLKEPERFRYWLYAVARNECLRRGRLRPRREEREDREDEYAADAGTAAEDADGPGRAGSGEPGHPAEPAGPGEGPAAGTGPDPYPDEYDEDYQDVYDESPADGYGDPPPDSYQDEYQESDEDYSGKRPEKTAARESGGPGARTGEPRAGEPDPGEAAGGEVDLLAAATAALTRDEQELVELATRHALPVREIAVVRGWSPTQAQDRVGDARAHLERALAALWTIHTAATPCPDLVGLLERTDGELTPGNRGRVARHLSSCPTCADQSRREPHPTATIPALVDKPFQAAPPLLWNRIELHGYDPGLAPEREAVLRRAGRFDARTGFPRPLDRPRRRRLALVGVPVAVAAVLAAGVAAAQLLPVVADGQPEAAPTPAVSAPAASPGRNPTPGAEGDGPVVAGQATAPTPSAGSSSAAPPPPPPPAPGEEEPAPLGVAAGVDVDCVAGGLFGYRLVVSAEASQPLSEAALSVTTGTGTDTYPLTVSGAEASGESDLLVNSELEWSVEVRDADGETATTGSETLRQPCG